MKLYYMPGACSLAVHIALREVGAPFELVRVDGKTRQTEHGEDYRAINPKGYVPALLLDDGDMLTEVTVLLEFIGDQHPETGLVFPHGTRERYHQMEWLHFLATELHKSFGPFFKPGFGEQAQQTLREAILERTALLDRQLAERPYLCGERFSAPDAYLFVMLLWMRHLRFDLSKYTHLARFGARVRERPAVEAALSAEGLEAAH